MGDIILYVAHKEEESVILRVMLKSSYIRNDFKCTTTPCHLNYEGFPTW